MDSMNKTLFPMAFAVGLISVVWVGLGFVGTSWLALVMTVAIAAVYLLGAYELKQFRTATASLALALDDMAQPLPSLGVWLERLPSSLQNAVRLRVESGRAALPGPALTPYLVGLLVMLGMLGTFLGMVVTFKGAVFALEGSTDLEAIRSALAAPIKGLGLSFGTSVAGVSASAMLGLMSALSRRERASVARLLDTRIATVLRPFSLAHQREESARALQVQARALPEVVDRLNAMMAQMEQRNQQLNAQLSGRQEQFHREVTVVYTELASAVGKSLQDSLVASARMAAERVQPVVEAAMAEIAQASQRQHERVSETVQAQLTGLGAEFSATARSVTEGWTTALQNQARSSETLVSGLDRALASFTDTFAQRSHSLLVSVNESAAQSQAGVARLLTRSEELINSRIAAEADWTAHHGERMDQLASLWRQELGALRDDEASRGQAAVARLGELQAALATQLATLGTALEAPLSRLMQTAAEAPQAAAELIAQLRQEMTGLTERDNLALEERTGLMERISALLEATDQTIREQRGAIESLVASAAAALDQAGSQFSQVLGTQADKASDIAAHVTGSAIELSSLGESFHQAVKLFVETNDKMIESLQRIEGAVNQSMARSDEQLAYYVGQAREVIDLSLTSQKAVIDDLRRLQGQQALQAEGSV